jgi:serine/threonine protein kinase
MLTGKLPFEHSTTNKLYKLMATGNYEEVIGVSSSLKSLLKAMIEPNPSLRINAVDISSHIWVKSYNYNFYGSSN